MTVHTGIVEGISYKYDKFSVLVKEADGTEGWYGTKKEFADEWPAKPNRGDKITFDDAGRKYLSKMRILESAGGSAGAAAGSKSGSNYNLGVEVGHASNLAMRVMEQRLDHQRLEIGSSEYWKQFAKDTNDIYKIMTGIKARIGGTNTPEEAPEAPPVKKPEPSKEVDDMDIF